MNPKEYLKEVSQTIATHGHRSNGIFIEAARVANGGSAVVFCDESKKDYETAKYVRNAIANGLKLYMPTHPYFEARVAVEYAALVAKFNSVI